VRCGFSARLLLLRGCAHDPLLPLALSLRLRNGAEDKIV
jgi:hypothetical protein